MNVLFKKIINIFKITSRQRKLILMVFWLSIYRNLLLSLKYKKAFSEHIYKNQHYSNSELTKEKIAIAKDIALAIFVVNKIILWKNVCRHQSWQAVVLLLKYQIPFEYFVGIDITMNLKEAHSWVKVNKKFICGNCNEKKYLLIIH